MDDLRLFLLAVAELADENGDASEGALRERYPDEYHALRSRASERRYLKSTTEPGSIALTTMGRFAAGTLG